MKGFFTLFTDSAKSLKDLRTLTTTGILLAMAIAIRSLAIPISEDLRITFTFIPISLIAILYGPVVCGMSTFALDLIGFIIDNRNTRGYSIELALIVILSGVIYGMILYGINNKQKVMASADTYIRLAIARLAVVVICNMCLNSYFIYSLYVNKDFSLIGSSQSMWEAFGIWIFPRLSKNMLQYPIDVVLLSCIAPAACSAYNQVRAQFGHAKAKAAK